MLHIEYFGILWKFDIFCKCNVTCISDITVILTLTKLCHILGKLIIIKFDILHKFDIKHYVSFNNKWKSLSYFETFRCYNIVFLLFFVDPNARPELELRRVPVLPATEFVASVSSSLSKPSCFIRVCIFIVKTKLLYQSLHLHCKNQAALSEFIASVGSSLSKPSCLFKKAS